MQKISLALGLLAIVIGSPTLIAVSSPVAVAQARQPSFPGWYITTSVANYASGNGYYKASIKVHIRNDSGRPQALTAEQRLALRAMVLVDGQNNAYSGEIEGDISAPFQYGENRTVEFKVNIPMGIYPQYLYLQTSEQKEPLKLPL